MNLTGAINLKLTSYRVGIRHADTFSGGYLRRWGARFNPDLQVWPAARGTRGVVGVSG